MPFVVNKDGDKFCVFKVSNGKKTKLKGGCHNTRKEAVAQMTAINISESEKREGKNADRH